MATPGKIKSPLSNLVTAQNVVANRIANIVLPRTANSIFDALKTAQQADGTYVDPRGSVPLSATSLSRTPLYSPNSKTSTLAQQLTTRDSLGLSLPNLAYAPKTGIASSPARKRPTIKNTQLSHGGHGHGAEGECQVTNDALDFMVAGGMGDAAQSGDTKYVDDNGWSVTLKQILGSKALTPEMIQRASIQNVSKYLTFSGGSQKDRDEIKYMFQRAMLEGFIRGVDITKGLKAGGVKYTWTNMGGNVIGSRSNTTVGGKAADHIKLDIASWNRKSDAAQYTLFLHEVVGHGVLNVNAQHNTGTSKKFQQANRVMTPIYKTTITENYNHMMDGLFREGDYKKFGITRGTTGGGALPQGGYPPLNGIDSSGAPVTPQTPGQTPGGDNGSATNPDGTIRDVPNGGYFEGDKTTNNFNFQPMEFMGGGGDGGVGAAPTITGQTGGVNPVQHASTLAPQGLSSDVVSPTRAFAMADLSRPSKQGGALAA